MGELDKNHADELVERLARKKTFLDPSTLERYDESNHNFQTEEYFINGYSYRIFNFEEGRSLDTNQK